MAKVELMMAQSIDDIEKRRGRGRPATNATPVLVRIEPRELAALDAYVAAADRMTRPQVIRAALANWLAGQGYLKPGDP